MDRRALREEFLSGIGERFRRQFVNGRHVGSRLADATGCSE